MEYNLAHTLVEGLAMTPLRQVSLMQEHRSLIKRASAWSERQLDKPAHILEILWECCVILNESLRGGALVL